MCLLSVLTLIDVCKVSLPVDALCLIVLNQYMVGFISNTYIHIYCMYGFLTTLKLCVYFLLLNTNTMYVFFLCQYYSFFINT